MKKMITLALILSMSIGINAQQKNTQNTEIHWMTMSEALEKNAKKPKKILVDFYTDWCGWCKRMDKATYEDPTVVKYINENYYAVKFNAEREAPLLYKGKTYQMPNVPAGQRATHEFAIDLLKGKLGYPTTAILNSSSSLIQNMPGYIEPVEMAMILKYFSQDKYLSMPYDKFKSEETAN